MTELIRKWFESTSKLAHRVDLFNKYCKILKHIIGIYEDRSIKIYEEIYEGYAKTKEQPKNKEKGGSKSKDLIPLSENDKKLLNGTLDINIEYEVFKNNDCICALQDLIIKKLGNFKKISEKAKEIEDALAAEKKEKDELTEAAEDMAKELENAENDLADQKIKAQEALAALEEAKDEALAAAEEAKDAALAALQQKMADIENMLNLERYKVKTCEDEKANAKKLEGELQKALEEEKANAKKLEGELANEKANAKKLGEDLGEEKAKAQKLEDELEKSLGEAQKAEADAKKLEEELAKAKKAEDQLAAEKVRAKKRDTEMNKAFKDKETALNKANNAIADIARLSAEINKLKADLENKDFIMDPKFKNFLLGLGIIVPGNSGNDTYISNFDKQIINNINEKDIDKIVKNIEKYLGEMKINSRVVYKKMEKDKIHAIASDTASVAKNIRQKLASQVTTIQSV